MFLFQVFQWLFRRVNPEKPDHLQHYADFKRGMTTYQVETEKEKSKNTCKISTVCIVLYAY